MLQELDEKVRNLIVAVSNGQPSVEEIRSLISTSTATINQHTSNEFEKERNRQSNIDFQKRLLESLYFPEMNSRQEEIKEAHKRTFNWLFDESGEELGPWSNYTEWLRTGQGTYWISGKAGSGKSTLMNMLYHDERTMDYLKAWTEPRQLITANFFFWKAGTEMQRTHLGLLRSLLYQLLSAILETINHLPTISGIRPHILQVIPAWTEKRLSTAILELIAYCSSSFRICIFIDGLDEFTGDQNTLLSWIETLSKASHIKTCLSSRPLLRYEEKLSSSAMLRLQDLTRADIEAYTSARLADAEYPASFVAGRHDWIKHAVYTIVDRAAGVFIWVELAVNNQLEGLHNQDSYQQLQDRLQSFPSELEDIYAGIVHRIDKVYRRECALYLSMALHKNPLLLRQAALSGYNGLDELLELFPNHTGISVFELCGRTSRRIRATCRGLLEVHLLPQGSDKLSDSSDRLTPCSQRECVHHQKLSLSLLGFMHRTVVEFLQENETGRSFINDANLDTAGIDVMFVKADIAALLLNDGCSSRLWKKVDFDGTCADDFDWTCTDGDLDQGLANLLQNIMMNLTLCGEAHAEALVCLTERIDYILSSPQYWRTTHVNETHRLVFERRPYGTRPNLYYDGITKELLGKFLVLTACYGLNMYVLYKLDMWPAPHQLAVRTHLLKCVCLHARPYFQKTHIKLATSLLRGGVSADAKSEISTIWAEFLTSNYTREYDSDFGRARLDATVEMNLLRGLFLAFLNRGADAHQTLFWSLRWVHPLNLTFHRPPYKLKVVDLHFLLSPLTMVRQCMWDSDDYPAVEQAFKSQGATERSVCTAMSLQRKTESSKERTIFQLSSQQSAQVVTCWDHLRTLLEEKLRRAALERFETEICNIAQEEYDELDWQDVGRGVP